LKKTSRPGETSLGVRFLASRGENKAVCAGSWGRGPALEIATHAAPRAPSQPNPVLHRGPGPNDGDPGGSSGVQSSGQKFRAGDFLERGQRRFRPCAPAVLGPRPPTFFHYKRAWPPPTQAPTHGGERRASFPNPCGPPTCALRARFRPFRPRRRTGKNNTRRGTRETSKPKKKGDVPLSVPRRGPNPLPSTGGQHTDRNPLYKGGPGLKRRSATGGSPRFPHFPHQRIMGGLGTGWGPPPCTAHLGPQALRAGGDLGGLAGWALPLLQFVYTQETRASPRFPFGESGGWKTPITAITGGTAAVGRGGVLYRVKVRFGWGQGWGGRGNRGPRPRFGGCPAGRGFLLRRFKVGGSWGGPGRVAGRKRAGTFARF